MILETYSGFLIGHPGRPAKERNPELDRYLDNRAIAVRLQSPCDKDSLPVDAAWERAFPVSFCSDWRGEHSDPQRETEVRLLWSRENLFIQFRCRYREIYVYDGAPCRRDQLWLRDVAEVFIQPDPGDFQHYREFEVSANGDSLDLDINKGEKSVLFCDLKSRVVCGAEGIWIAAMAIPMGCLTGAFDPDQTWRLNLFRIEGREPNRFYSAWQPTHTSKPNFHVPEYFGELQFK
jgi:hypothetical protein